jgi:predicted enzyme related to lactoylglutathione lyase
MGQAYHTIVILVILKSPAEDVEKMRRFYSELFSWKIKRAEVL